MLPATGIPSTTIADTDEVVVTSVAASPVRTRSAATLDVLVTEAAASATFTISPSVDVVVDIEAVAAPRFTFWASTEVVIVYITEWYEAYCLSAHLQTRLL